jgi:hypothetical protein
MLSVVHARGRIIGAGILTLMGALWYLLAVALWPAHPGWSIPAGSLAAALLLIFCVQRLWAFRSVPRIHDPAAAARGKRAGMWFGIIFGIEGLSIGLCSMLLAHFGWSDWIPLAAAALVGLHFIPLARVFEVPLYYWTGSLTVMAMAACALIGDPNRRVLVAGVVMAAVLWLTAICLLLTTRVEPRPV